MCAFLKGNYRMRENQHIYHIIFRFAGVSTRSYSYIFGVHLLFCYIELCFSLLETYNYNDFIRRFFVSILCFSYNMYMVLLSFNLYLTYFIIFVSLLLLLGPFQHLKCFFFELEIFIL